MARIASFILNGTAPTIGRVQERRAAQNESHSSVFLEAVVMQVKMYSIEVEGRTPRAYPEHDGSEKPSS